MAKKYSNLYHKIYNPLNLWAAYKKAAKGKRYKPPAASFEYELEKNLLKIEAELRSESYRSTALNREGLPTCKITANNRQSTLKMPLKTQMISENSCRLAVKNFVTVCEAALPPKQSHRI